ncbi:MAG: hypothetical protein AB7K24_06990 [Gemmataceae bacterium]
MLLSDTHASETVYFPQDAPEAPAVFVAYADRNGSERIAHIGFATNLRKALEGHFKKRMRDTFPTGSTQLTEIRWWLHDDFHDPVVLEAACLVAHDALERKAHKKRKSATAWQMHRDKSFCFRMANALSGKPNGRLLVPSMPQVLKRLHSVERRLRQLEKRLDALEPVTTKH